MFEDVVDIYKSLEPDGIDTWSPINSDMELYHRMALMEQLCICLKIIGHPAKIKALDIGCGVGRSSRLLVDLNIIPQNITAVDLRESALVTAKKFNNMIDYKHVDSLNEIENLGEFDLVILCTVLSSINPRERESLILSIKKIVKKNGYIFFWDAIKSNDFAGGDLINIENYFDKILYNQKLNLRIFPYIMRKNQNIKLAFPSIIKQLLSILRFYLKGGNLMSHQAILVKSDK